MEPRTPWGSGKMESYLIRIYRRNENNPEGITGTVQEIVSSENRAFKSLAELGEFIIGKDKDNPSGKKPVPPENCRL